MPTLKKSEGPSLFHMFLSWIDVCKIPVSRTQNPTTQMMFFSARNGLYSSIAGMRFPTFVVTKMLPVATLKRM